MTQLERYESFIRSRGCQVTLGEILRTEFSAEYRRLNIEMRDDLGWFYTVELSRKHGANVYTFLPPVRTSCGLQRVMA